MPALSAPAEGTGQAWSRAGAAKVVAGWAGINIVLVAILLVFGGHTLGFRLLMYGSGALLVLASAAAIRFPRATKQLPREDSVPSGAPSAAIALACLVVVLACVLTFWLIFLCLPLVAFIGARFYAEARHRRPGG